MIREFRYSFQFPGSDRTVEREFTGTVSEMGEIVQRLRDGGCSKVEYVELRWF